MYLDKETEEEYKRRHEAIIPKAVIVQHFWKVEPGEEPIGWLDYLVWMLVVVVFLILTAGIF